MATHKNVPRLHASAVTKPHFIIIGAMKSATTTLHVQLSRQPGFWMTELKEPNFFSDEPVWSKGLDWYAKLFAGAAPSDLCGESSTHYTKLPDYPNTLSRMRSHVPDAKLIYVMRHPLDRLVSHYMHAWLEASMEGSIDEAATRYPQLIDYGRYAMQLRPFLESYGPNNVLPVFFERLTLSPQAELERVCAFLGYKGTPRWSEQDAQQNVSSERLRVSPVRDGLINFPPLRYIRQNMIPQAFRDRVKQRWQISEKPVLSPSVQERLVKTFDDDLAILGSWLATGLNCADFKNEVAKAPLDWSSLAPSP